MAEEIIGSDLLRIIANNKDLEGGGTIAGPVENMRGYAFFGVSVFSTQVGQVLIEYRFADGAWRTMQTLNIAANTALDVVYRKTRDEYRVSYTDISCMVSNVDLGTLRTNVN